MNSVYLNGRLEGLPKHYVAKVVHVYDGQTLLVEEEGGKQHRLVIWGIDTPEIDQPYGREARRCLEDMVDHEDLFVVPHRLDQYGREIVDLDAGCCVATCMLEAGAAWLDTVLEGDCFGRYPEFTKALDKAKKAQRGLWADKDRIPPWRWRYKKRHERLELKTDRQMDLYGELQYYADNFLAMPPQEIADEEKQYQRMLFD